MKKDSFSSIVNKIIYPTSLFFTIITLILYIGGASMSYGHTNMIPRLGTILMVLAFSFVLSIANIIMQTKKLHISLRVALHFVMTAVSFFVLFINASDYDAGSAFTIVLMIAYTAVYALICALVLGIRSAIKKSHIESSEYRSIYDKRV